MLSHLHNGWQVDQAILSEEDRVVVCIYFFIISITYNYLKHNFIIILNST